MEESRFLGMTVNERLFVSGLNDKFDNAVANKDVKTAINILKQVELSKEAILPILNHFNFDFALSDLGS